MCCKLITNTILGAPYYNYGIYAPKPYSGPHIRLILRLSRNRDPEAEAAGACSCVTSWKLTRLLVALR